MEFRLGTLTGRCSCVRKHAGVSGKEKVAFVFLFVLTYSFGNRGRIHVKIQLFKGIGVVLANAFITIDFIRDAVSYFVIFVSYFGQVV